MEEPHAGATVRTSSPLACGMIGTEIRESPSKPALQKLLSQVKASIRAVPLGLGAGPELTQGWIGL